MITDRFKFYVCEPDYADIYFEKARKTFDSVSNTFKTIPPVTSFRSDMLLIPASYVPFSDRPMHNDRIETYIMPIEDAARSLCHIFGLYTLAPVLYFDFFGGNTATDWPEDWDDKAIVKITTYGDDYCKMLVDMYLGGDYDTDLDNDADDICRNAKKLSAPMIFTNDNAGEYETETLVKLRDDFRPNHTESEILAIKAIPETDTTSITFKTTASNLYKMPWFDSDMKDNCECDDTVVVQMVVENPAVRVVTNHISFDEEPENEDTVDISEEDCVEDDEELSKLEAAVNTLITITNPEFMKDLQDNLVNGFEKAFKELADKKTELEERLEEVASQAKESLLDKKFHIEDVLKSGNTKVTINANGLITIYTRSPYTPYSDCKFVIDTNKVIDYDAAYLDAKELKGLPNETEFENRLVADVMLMCLSVKAGKCPAYQAYHKIEWLLKDLSELTKRSFDLRFMEKYLYSLMDKKWDLNDLVYFDSMADRLSYGVDEED